MIIYNNLQYRKVKKINYFRNEVVKMSFFNWRKLNFFDILRDVDKGEIIKNLGNIFILLIE